MDRFQFEGMATEMEADARAIITLTLDVNDKLTGEDADRLQAVLKLAEDQMRIADEMSNILVKE